MIGVVVFFLAEFKVIGVSLQGWTTAGSAFLASAAILMATAFEPKGRPKWLSVGLNALCVLVTVGGFTALWWSTGNDMRLPSVVAARSVGLTFFFLTLGLMTTMISDRYS